MIAAQVPSIRVISGETVRRLVQPADLMEPMRKALTGIATGTVWEHPRVAATPSADSTLLLMTGNGDCAVGAKILSMFGGAARRGLPAIQGAVLLFDAADGHLTTLVDGAAVTELRTAAVSAVATDALAPSDATSLAVLGAGVQARSHLLALRGLREWSSVRLYAPRPERVHAVARWAATQGVEVEPVATAAGAVRGADVVCTVTSAGEPVLDADDLRMGAHVNAVGAYGPTRRELPADLVAASDLFVEQRSAAMREAGDVLLARAEGALDPSAPLVELGDVLTGAAPGRVDADAASVFVSVGLAVEDVAACEFVLRRAIETDSGSEIEL